MLEGRREEAVAVKGWERRTKTYLEWSFTLNSLCILTERLITALTEVPLDAASDTVRQQSPSRVTPVPHVRMLWSVTLLYVQAVPGSRHPQLIQFCILSFFGGYSFIIFA
jgi:hypothetical protein